MDALTVLVTGAGAPGIKGTLYSLKNNFDNRPIRTIGTDIKKEVVGTYLCDSFYQISKPSEKEYLEQLLSICEHESVDVILPQNTVELPVLAENKTVFSTIGVYVAISDCSAISLANDKFKIMKLAKQIGIPAPDYFLVDNFDTLKKAALTLGWPDRPVVIKPPISNGMRGVRIIDESIDRKTMFYSEKPTSLFANMMNIHDILGFDFPPLLVMEYLPGAEYTVDVLKNRGYTVIPRKRDIVQSGITFQGTVVYHEELVNYAKKLSDALGLQYAFGFQFKMDACGNPKLLESNPRIQGTMVLSTFAGANIIYAAVKLALIEDVPAFQIRWGTKILRYWGGLGIFNGNIVDLL
ncbi:MAG: ATP-grasp domain-containing protein [Methanoregula sp.]|nr:ATP-grasp domain-containing protein [Methanoregula sp.]